MVARKQKPISTNYLKIPTSKIAHSSLQLQIDESIGDVSDLMIQLLSENHQQAAKLLEHESFWSTLHF